MNSTGKRIMSAPVNTQMYRLFLTGALVTLLSAVTATAESYSPTVDRDIPRNVYWGDTHVHSSLSADATVMGNTRLPPRDAYRFARGETVVANNGMEARLDRPLDFLVVSDHAEYLGLMTPLADGDERVLASPAGRRWHEMWTQGGAKAAEAGLEIIMSIVRAEPEIEAHEEIRKSAWQEAVAAAEEAYTPRDFTALIGYEWTAMPGGDNLHRVVVFRDGPDKLSDIQPFSLFDSEDPRDLWNFLEEYERDTGGSAIAIPHNSNLSNGRMFAETTEAGEPFDLEYATQRIRWEPVMEVTQIKGDSESHPFLSPDDEFASYGLWDKGNLGATSLKAPEMLRYEYARSALQTGLRLAEEIGVNPYQFGMIGSTDSHTSLATADSDNFWGKASYFEPGGPGRTEQPFLSYSDDESMAGWDQLAAGYAAVWARENTREAIFDALQRREVYASTGPRITLRFFGGWQFQEGDEATPDLAALGYERGVPMGGELPERGELNEAKAPVFLIGAMRDPQGANLDRIQVVKAWLGDDGESLHEKVYDVDWADERTPDEQGRLPAIGNTVDSDDATYSNTIGAPQLATVWRDPEFNPAQRAFYYLRVLEIPTPRWVLHDAKRLGTDVPEGVQTTVQERAYSSPIWYTP